MKKILLFLTIILFINFNLNSQICSLGNEIIEKNNFKFTKSLLIHYEYRLFTDEELQAFGLSPKIKIIGTKGSNPSNSISVNVESLCAFCPEIKVAEIICSKVFSTSIENDLITVGYKKNSEREYIEANRFHMREKTYIRISKSYKDKVIIKYATDGTTIASFQRTNE